MFMINQDKKPAAIFLCIAFLCSLSGCLQPTQPPKPITPVLYCVGPDGDASTTATFSDEFLRAEAIRALESGEEAAATHCLNQLLARDAEDAQAKSLLQQIETEPNQLLGNIAFGYQVKAGDTFKTLAEQHLGDGMQFYLLARYNEKAPYDLMVGDWIKLPKPKKAASTSNGKRNYPRR